jgi:aromatic ring-cleaving dioxygenase
VRAFNRDGLTVLLHPETGDDYVDHSAHAAWFGAVLPCGWRCSANDL